MVLTLVATILGVIGFIPYLRDIFLLKTKPHSYTWLIWFLTQGTAVCVAWYGGSGWGILNLIVGVFLVFVVFIFSLKYGTKNISKGDTITLIAVLCAILVWWQLDQPILSVFIVSIIDLVGYFPSFRKTWQEPWSETLSTWAIFAVSDIFSLLALAEYNFLTVTYLVSITIANLVLFLVASFRRSSVSRPGIFIKP